MKYSSASTGLKALQTTFPTLSLTTPETREDKLTWLELNEKHGSNVPDMKTSSLLSRVDE